MIHILVKFQIKQSTIFSKFTQELLSGKLSVNETEQTKQNKTKHVVFMCNAERGSGSGHRKQAFHLHRCLRIMPKACAAVNQNVNGKTVTLLEGNKGQAKMT